MKDLGEITFTKEWMKTLDKTRILAATDLENLVSFPRYGRLNEKCLDDFFPQIVNVSFCSLDYRRAV